MEDNNRSPWEIRGERERESLELVKTLLLQLSPDSNIIASSDIYAHYDLLVDDNVYLEVKERFMTAPNFKKYSNQGMIFEKIKYDFLSKRLSRYINHFTIDGLTFLMVWNIRNMEINFSGMSCKMTTEFSNNNYIKKSVGLLHPNDANIYILKDSIWERISYAELINKL